MRLLVTGGLGVNGSWVTRRLAHAGHEPVVFDQGSDTSLVADVIDDVEILRGDVREIDTISSAIARARIDRVIHMAGLLGAVQRVPYDGFAINAAGTVNVLEAAVRADLDRVVFASSRAVYGGAIGEHAHPTYRPFTEDDPPRPRYVYEVLKLACESMGRNYSEIHGIAFASLRFAHIVGPGKSAQASGHSVPSRMIEDTLNGRPVTVDHGGDQRDDIIYAADMAQGVLLAATAEVSGSRVYNISRGEATTLGDLAAAIRRQIPDAQIAIGPGLNYMDAREAWYGPLDNARAHRELGFAPEFDLDGMVADWRAHTGLLAGHQGGRGA